MTDSAADTPAHDPSDRRTARFCAGVDRAIIIVERALEKYGAPVYVRHEIVHNKYVVDSLKAKGAIFVEELDEVPDGVPVVFSAHGVPKAVPAEAEDRGLDYLDATCPLVSKVHRQAERQVKAGRHILFIGHKGHPEVIGTFGQVPDGVMTLIETVADAQALYQPADPANLAYLTQTTLSVDDTAAIIATLRRALSRHRRAQGRGYLLRHLQPPGSGEGDAAGVRRGLSSSARPTAPTRCDWSNVAERAGTPRRLIQRAEPTSILAGWTASGRWASPPAPRHPEVLVREVVDAIASALSRCRGTQVEAAQERMAFKLPAGWRQSEPWPSIPMFPPKRLAPSSAAMTPAALVSAKGIAEGRGKQQLSCWKPPARMALATAIILTLYEKRVDEADLPFFMDLLDHLGARGCLVPRFIADRDGQQAPAPCPAGPPASLSF
jgi:4-hydroxy-3-methylbut-2-enyl diphosphate reductase